MEDMEREEIQELIRSTITEMLAEIQPEEPDQPVEPETPDESSRPDPEQQTNELDELRSQIKQLTAAIHHANFINAGMPQPAPPEKTTEDVFWELINPPRKEN